MGPASTLVNHWLTSGPGGVVRSQITEVYIVCMQMVLAAIRGALIILKVLVIGG